MSSKHFFSRGKVFHVVLQLHTLLFNLLCFFTGFLRLFCFYVTHEIFFAELILALVCFWFIRFLSLSSTWSLSKLLASFNRKQSLLWPYLVLNRKKIYILVDFLLFKDASGMSLLLSFITNFLDTF